MKIQLERIGGDYLFQCTNAQGNHILLDNTGAENPKGVSPMEALLMSVAGCSGIDLVAILKKQRQTITSFQAEVEGERVPVDEAKPFRGMRILFKLEGEIEPKKALRAAELSFEKYCSVTKSLHPDNALRYEVWVNGTKAE